jgi:hypothetical protein
VKTSFIPCNDWDSTMVIYSFWIFG